MLVIAGLVAGATGSWSPCGFSMVETIGRADRRLPVTLLACLTFTVGALAGGQGGGAEHERGRAQHGTFVWKYMTQNTLRPP